MIYLIYTLFLYSAQLKFYIQSEMIETKTRTLTKYDIRGELFVVRLISRCVSGIVVSLPCSGSLPKAHSIVCPGTGNTHPYNRRAAHSNITEGESALGIASRSGNPD